jgi:predicted HTH domain antitoxin
LRAPFLYPNEAIFLNEVPNMSTTITIDLPDDAFSALRSSPEDFVREMRLAAAAKWYEIGLVSQSKAAQLAGVSRERFLDALSRLQVSPFQETPEELTAEVTRE